MLELGKVKRLFTFDSKEVLLPLPLLSPFLQCWGSTGLVHSRQSLYHWARAPALASISLQVELNLTQITKFLIKFLGLTIIPSTGLQQESIWPFRGSPYLNLCPK